MVDREKHTRFGSFQCFANSRAGVGRRARRVALAAHRLESRLLPHLFRVATGCETRVCLLSMRSAHGMQSRLGGTRCAHRSSPPRFDHRHDRRLGLSHVLFIFFLSSFPGRLDLSYTSSFRFPAGFSFLSLSEVRSHLFPA